MNGHEKVADGAYCEIWFSDKALKVFKKGPPNDRARMNRIMDHLSKHGYEDLNDKQFKTEGRFPAGDGNTVLVYAAKAYQLRLYGFFMNETPRKFICPEAAIKKDNKADQKQLKRVARKVGD